MLTLEVAKEIKGKGKPPRRWIHMNREAADPRPNQGRSPRRRTGAGPLRLPARCRIARHSSCSTIIAVMLSLFPQCILGVICNLSF